MYLQIRKLSVNALLVDKNRGELALIFPGNPTEKCYSRVYIYISNANSIDYSLPAQENDAFYSNRKSTLSFQTYNFYLEISKSPKTYFSSVCWCFGRHVHLNLRINVKKNLSNTNFDRKVDITRLTITNVSCNEIKITKINL